MVQPDPDDLLIFEPRHHRPGQNGLLAGLPLGGGPVPVLQQGPQQLREHQDAGDRVARDPQNGLFPQYPRIAGLPGFMAMPWYSTCPTSRMTAAEWSSRPAEDPALSSTASHWSRAVRTASRMASRLSGTMG